MITYYFVDIKGLDTNILSRVIDLNENDIVHIMYNSANSVISFQTHFALMKAKAKILYRNLLYNKMLIATEIGYTIRSYAEKECKFYLVSNSIELESLVGFWKERNIDISLVKTIPLKKSISQTDEKNGADTNIPQKRSGEDDEKSLTDRSFNVLSSEDYLNVENEKTDERMEIRKPIYDPENSDLENHDNSADGDDCSSKEDSLILQQIPF